MTEATSRRPDAEAIRVARERIRDAAIRTPLVRLEIDRSDAPELWVKLENLQPIGSFKIRGAANAMAAIAAGERPGTLEHGVVTASAGNMGQGVAWNARRLGVPCRVIVPDHAPAAKVGALRRYGAEVVPLPFDRWWQALVEHGHPDVEGRFIHPVTDPDVIAGNATIGLEIAEDLDAIESVVVPYGGGGLSCGIAAALADVRPEAGVWAAEVSAAAPLAASLAAGEPVAVEYTATFVDGIGGKGVLEEMWPLARTLLRGSLVATPDAIAEAVRTLAARARVVAEGAGAAALAAALDGGAGNGRTVCVVSGGNIDPDVLATALKGETP